MSKKMIIDLVLCKDFICLGPPTLVTVYNVTMVTLVMLYTYSFRCADPHDPYIQSISENLNTYS